MHQPSDTIVADNLQLVCGQILMVCAFSLISKSYNHPLLHQTLDMSNLMTIRDFAAAA